MSSSEEPSPNHLNFPGNLTREERIELPPRDESPEGARLDLLTDGRIEEFDRQVSNHLRSLPVPFRLRDRVERDLAERRRLVHQFQSRRRWAVGAASLAASFLLLVMVQPFFGRYTFDAELLAGKLDSIHEEISLDLRGLTPVRPTAAWPSLIDPATCVGEKVVEFLGERVPAYRLSAGPEIATLLILPERTFPFQLGNSHVATTHSARHIDTHYFASGRQVCILILRDGADVHRFYRRSSVT